MAKRFGIALILFGFGLLCLALVGQTGCARPSTRQPLAVPTPWCILLADPAETVRACFLDEERCVARRSQILGINGLSADVGECRLEWNR